MRDITFSYAMLVLAAATMGPYGARALLRGRVRNDRVEKDGGSVFVGKGFMEFGYWLVNPVVAALHRSGVTPDMVTACQPAAVVIFCMAIDGSTNETL